MSTEDFEPIRSCVMSILSYSEELKRKVSDNTGVADPDMRDAYRAIEQLADNSIREAHHLLVLLTAQLCPAGSLHDDGSGKLPSLKADLACDRERSGNGNINKPQDVAAVRQLLASLVSNSEDVKRIARGFS